MEGACFDLEDSTNICGQFVEGLSLLHAPNARSVCREDNTVHAWMKGDWQSVVNVRDNYQRQHRHQLERGITTDKLRVSINVMNGDSCAAIYEVRVYGR